MVVARVEGASPGERVALRVDDELDGAQRLTQAGAGVQRCRPNQRERWSSRSA